MNTVAVISASGKKLMPTNSYRARKLLKSRKAIIYKYRPVFTIKLVDRADGDTQPIEYKCDTGYQYIGISICSDKKEFINEQRALLKDEAKKHSNCSKYRRVRRNRLRHRKARWSNRKGLISVKGIISNGTRIVLNERNPVSIKKVDKIVHTGGWVKII